MRHTMIAIMVALLLACFMTLARAESVTVSDNSHSRVSYVPSSVEFIGRGWYRVVVGYYYKQTGQGEACIERYNTVNYRSITDTCYDPYGNKRSGGGLTEIYPGSVAEALLFAVQK